MCTVTALGFFDPEGIGDAPDGAISRDQHYVKAHAHRAMARIGGKPGLGGGDQARALARAKSEGGFCQRRPRLDFNKGEQAVAFGDQVNLAGFGAASLGKYHPALSGQRGGGQRFRILPGGIGAPPAQQAMGGWGLAGHGHESLAQIGYPENKPSEGEKSMQGARSFEAIASSRQRLEPKLGRAHPQTERH